MEENKDNEALIQFIKQLSALNGELVGLFDTGNVELFTDMNKTIKELYRLQHGSEDDAFRTIDPDCEIIYRNFDMIIAVLRTTEDGVIDKGAQTSINKFLHNIHEAVFNIVSMFGLA